MKENKRKGNSRPENIGRKKQAPPPPPTTPQLKYHNLGAGRMIDGKLLITDVRFHGVSKVEHSLNEEKQGVWSSVYISFNPDTRELLLSYE